MRWNLARSTTMLALLLVPAVAASQALPESASIVTPTTDVFASAESAEVVDVLPFGTSVQAGEGTGERMSITLASGRTGFVPAASVGDAVPPSRLPPAEAHGDICGCAQLAEGRSYYADTEQVIRHNEAAGLDYCVHPFVDDAACERIRPAPDGRGLPDRERALRPESSLNERLALWTQAFAPESPYRQHGSLDTLRNSPLFAPHPGDPHRNARIGDHFPRLFNSAELHRASAAPPNVWMLVVTPTNDGIAFGQPGGFGSPGAFPPTEFTLLDDRTIALSPLEAVFYDPCAMEFTPSSVPTIRFDPATGSLTGTLADAAVAERLAACRVRLIGETTEYHATAVDSQFMMVVDRTPTRLAAQALTVAESHDRTVPADEHLAVEFGAFPVQEVRLGPQDAPIGYFRTAVYSECGDERLTALQFRDGATWHALTNSSQVHFCSP